MRQIPESQAERLPGHVSNLRDVASERAARYLVTGEISRDTEQVTVSLDLVDGETGAQVWHTRLSCPRTRRTATRAF